MKRTTLILICGIMLVGVFSMALPARGATVDVASYTADKDAGVWEALPDDNYGTANFLYVGNFSNSHESAYFGFTFVKPTVTWTKAEIRLTILDSSIDYSAYVDVVTGPWNETGMQGNITWNNRPALGAPITTWYFYKSMPYATVVTIDITTLMSSLTNNISICLYVITLPPNGVATFLSREDSTDSHRPKLAFTNTVADGIAGYDIAFLGLITFGMVFFLRKKMSKHTPK